MDADRGRKKITPGDLQDLSSLICGWISLLVRVHNSRLLAVRNGFPWLLSHSSSFRVQSQSVQAQGSSPLRSRQFLRAWASLTLSSSKYSSQYGRSSASGVVQKQTSSQVTA